MTISQLQEIVEPLDDACIVQWGCVDPDIPRRVYANIKSNLAMFKQFLNSNEPWDECKTQHEGKDVVIKQWLIGTNEITFYMGYTDES